MALAADTPRQLFISYAGKDQAYRAELETHLAPLVRRRLIESWHEGKVGPGQPRHEETAAHLAQADLIVILISPDYLATDDLYVGELAQALRRHEQGAARVIPIALRPVHQPGTALTPLQSLPRNGPPISQWADRDAAWAQVVAEIASALASLPGADLPPPLIEMPPGPRPERVGTGRWAVLGLVGAAAAAGLVAVLGVGRGSQQPAGKPDAGSRGDSATSVPMKDAAQDLAQTPRPPPAPRPWSCSGRGVSRCTSKRPAPPSRSTTGSLRITALVGCSTRRADRCCWVGRTFCSRVTQAPSERAQ